jgi:hypothetical protein
MTLQVLVCSESWKKYFLKNLFSPINHNNNAIKKLNISIVMYNWRDSNSQSSKWKLKVFIHHFIQHFILHTSLIHTSYFMHHCCNLITSYIFIPHTFIPHIFIPHIFIPHDFIHHWLHTSYITDYICPKLCIDKEATTPKQTIYKMQGRSSFTAIRFTIVRRISQTYVAFGTMYIRRTATHRTASRLVLNHRTATHLTAIHRLLITLNAIRRTFFITLVPTILC